MSPLECVLRKRKGWSKQDCNTVASRTKQIGRSECYVFGFARWKPAALLQKQSRCTAIFVHSRAGRALARWWSRPTLTRHMLHYIGASPFVLLFGNMNLTLPLLFMNTIRPLSSWLTSKCSPRTEKRVCCLSVAGDQARGKQASSDQGVGRGQAPSLRPRASRANDPETCHRADTRGNAHGHSAAALVEVGFSVVYAK